MILREIITKLGFEIDQKKIGQFHNAITKMKSDLASLAPAAQLAKNAIYGIVAATTALSLLALHTAKSVRATDQLAEKLDVTAEELQSVELAAQSTGLGVNELSDSMATFHSKLGDLSTGNTEASREIKKLGITFSGSNGQIKSSFQLFEELAQKIDAIKNPISKANALQKIFGTENIEVARLFKNGGEAIKKQREEIEKIGYIISTDGIKSSKEYLKSWAEFQIILSSVKKELSIKFMPVFKEMMEAFKGWFIDNKKLISQNISSFINILSKVLGVLFRAINMILTPISKLIDIMGGLENTVSVLGIAFAVVLTPKIYAAVAAIRTLTVTMLANPITWITVAIGLLAVAIGLLVNDLWHWVKGNDSVIGRVLADWKGFKIEFFNIIDSINEYFVAKFKAMAEWFSDFWNNTLNLDDILNKISKATGITKTQDNTTGNTTTLDHITKGGLKVYTSQPLLNPNSASSSIVPSNTFSTKDVKQYITENITITVPTGTSSEQARAIATQVTQEMQLQFDVNMQRGLDSLGSR